MSCVSYARDFYGSYARNLVREFLSRLFNGATPGVCLRIAPDENIDSLASDLLQAAGWSVASRSEDVTEGEIQLVLVEPGNCGAASDDPGNVADIAALVAARRPWVVLVNTKRQPLSTLEQRLSSVGFFFVWFDETYRYYLAAERTALLMPAFMEQLPLEKLTPPYVFSAERIAMTLGCRDCDEHPCDLPGDFLSRHSLTGRSLDAQFKAHAAHETSVRPAIYISIYDLASRSTICISLQYRCRLQSISSTPSDSLHDHRRKCGRIERPSDAS